MRKCPNYEILKSELKTSKITRGRMSPEYNGNIFSLFTGRNGLPYRQNCRQFTKCHVQGKRWTYFHDTQVICKGTEVHTVYCSYLKIFTIIHGCFFCLVFDYFASKSVVFLFKTQQFKQFVQWIWLKNSIQQM